MPEGDSVHQLSRRLQPLTGRRITAWDARVPGLATTDATGSVIERVWPWGKNLFWAITSAAGTDVLHTHLKMDGTWRIHPAGQRWSAPAHTARIVVRVEGSPKPADEIELVGHDLGLVEMWPLDRYAVKTAHLGPDPLGPDWDEPGRWEQMGRDEAIQRLTGCRGLSLGTAVVDQRVLAGVGNIYRNELCFLLGAHPATDVAQLAPARVVDLAAELLQSNRERPVRVFTGVDRRGENTYVYGRAGLPCRRCGATIIQGGLHHRAADPDISGQPISWCPNCQPSST